MVDREDDQATMMKEKRKKKRNRAVGSRRGKADIGRRIEKCEKKNCRIRGIWNVGSCENATSDNDHGPPWLSRQRIHFDRMIVPGPDTEEGSDRIH